MTAPISYLSTVAKTSRAAATLADLNGGTFRVRAAPVPTDGDTVPTGTVLATVALPTPCATNVAGLLTFLLPASIAVIASGTPACAELCKADGTHYATITAGQAAGAYCLTIDTDTVEIGGVLSGVGGAAIVLTWQEPGTGA